MPNPLTAGKNGYNTLDILRRQPVVVRHLDTLAGGVDKQRPVVRFALFQHHNAGGDARPEKQVCRKLDYTVDKVIIHKILPYLLFGATSVHDAGETDDSRRAVGGQPGQGVHDKGKVRLGLGSQHTSRGKAGVVDERGVAVPRPLDGVGRIGDDQLKGFIVPVLGRGQGVLAGDVELVKAHVMEEHIDAAKVVGGDIDLLPEVTELHPVLAQNLGRFQQQRAGAAGRHRPY